MFTRIVDPELIEHRLLELAFTSDAKLTAPALAYFAPCSIAAAQAVLDRLAAEDRVRMDIEDDGTVVYQVPARAKLPSARALVPAVPTSRALVAHRANPALAVVLAALIPGAGHLYAGHIAAAELWFFAVSAAYLLIVPGLVLHVISMVSAARAASQPMLVPYHATT
ncbi:MAG TPA: DUF6677 family protein [Kofleriaceae bacterium]|jgi:hypothetical protein|nr:DUF6677 family protein [Kofleriaceae bacterium]